MVLVIVGEAFKGKVKPGAQCHPRAPVDAHRRKIDSVEVGEGRRRAAWFSVDVEADRVQVEVEEDADDATRSDAPIEAAGVRAGVHVPAATVVNVHAPRFLVFTCGGRVKFPDVGICFSNC